VTESDSGKTVAVDVGDSLELSLNENPSTGYRWAIESLDTRVIAAQEGEYASTSGGVGVGGSVKWSLKAIAPGKTEFRLKLSRRWEGDGSVQKRFTVTLVVR
jgi:inhibitor of cysteine peptidase